MTDETLKKIDTPEVSFVCLLGKSKLHPGCECCVQSENRLQRALEAEAREYALIQKLNAVLKDPNAKL